ncbi:MAG TPA: hypothetical protein VMH23_13425, partial [Bacteroidota bacterium]|nr:hypothetical protein [Bacteroidota bacterium]
MSVYNKYQMDADTRTSDSSGTATIGPIPSDTNYSVRVNSFPADSSKIYGSEYWGSLGGIAVAGAETTAVTFIRNAPYTSNIFIHNAKTDQPVTGSAPFGTLLKISIEVTNPSVRGSVAQTVQCLLTLDRNKQSGYDFQAVSPARTMAIGTKDTFDFIVMPPDSG